MANLLDAALRSASAARRAQDPRTHLPALEAALAQTSDLLAMLGPTQRRRAPRDVGLSIFDAVHHAAEIMRPLAGEHGVQIRAEASAALRVYGAPGLFRALTDAIRNSLESIGVARCAAGGSSGAIAIAAAIEGSDVRVEVADDGAGPPASLADPFVAGVSSKPESLGLGLVVARHVVERLRGAAALIPGSGVHPGRTGATLRLVIPLESLTTLLDDASPPPP